MMRDIPMFTTEFGIASLMLKEVSYRQEAYIRVQDVQPGCMAQFLDECVGFCRAVGAEKVYAAAEQPLEAYPLHTAVYEMRGSGQVEGETAYVWPVTWENVAQWRQIYNEKMRHVDNAATLISTDEQQLVESAGACFVHDAGQPLGIGWIKEDKLLALAALVPGEGKRVLRTLLSTSGLETVMLEVASTNERAIGLYEKMGFVKVKELSRWYRVFPVDKP